MDALADPHQSSATARPLQFLAESRSDTRCRGAAAMAGKLRDGHLSCFLNALPFLRFISCSFRLSRNLTVA